MKRSAVHLRTGEAGEEAAVHWLERHGFRIEARNWRKRTGEIDVVAWQGSTLVFVEVKTRRGTAYGTGGEAVGAGKQARIQRAASAYLQRFGSRVPVCRFDVLEVDASGSGTPAVSHLPDAFRPGWN
jgi:putative endonuclease